MEPVTSAFTTATNRAAHDGLSSHGARRRLNNAHPPPAAAAVPTRAWSGAPPRADYRSRGRKKPARLILLLTAIILIVLFGYVLVRMDWKPVLIRVAADANTNNEAPQLSKTTAPNAPDEVSALNLRVDPRGNDAFELSWNPQSPIIKDAISGSLWINDDRHVSRFVHLNAEDLHSGRLMYMTGSGDVTFRFKVMDIVGRDTVQSFRVLKDAADNGGGLTAALKLGLVPGIEPSVSPSQNETHTLESAAPFQRPSVASSMEPASAEGSGPELHQLLNNPLLPLNGGAQVTLAPLPAVPEFVPETPIQVNNVPPPDKLLNAPERGVGQSSGTSSPPGVLFRYVPTLPRQLRHNLDVSVPVIVKISNSGTILAASLDTPGKNIPGELIRSALDAARRWRFSPAIVNGTPVPSSMTLRFHFFSK